MTKLYQYGMLIASAPRIIRATLMVAGLVTALMGMNGGEISVAFAGDDPGG